MGPVEVQRVALNFAHTDTNACASAPVFFQALAVGTMVAP